MIKVNATLILTNNVNFTLGRRCSHLQMEVGEESVFFLDVPPRHEIQFLEYFALDPEDKFLTEFITQPVIFSIYFHALFLCSCKLKSFQACLRLSERFWMSIIAAMKRFQKLIWFR